jgi:hypothetical protein
VAGRAARLAALVAGLGAAGGCGGPSSTPAAPASPRPPDATPPVYVVLFTHIEDNTPPGPLGSAASRTSYLNLRARLLEVATLVRAYGLRWSLQPDWKFLLAALEYEDAAATAGTGGANVLRYLRDIQGVAIDPHSHESGGYNYTDVAHLLGRLGVGGSTVIGGHVWDPVLPQFQEWDRFRVPVAGLAFPEASWRGDTLMGSGTPNHVNDPIVSGVWRPKDRYDYWTDDPAGNIACVGAWRGDVAGLSELRALHASGQVDRACMLTASYHLKPADITSPGGLAAIESAVVRPLAALRDGRQAVSTDFTALVVAWRQQFAGRACTYRER